MTTGRPNLEALQEVLRQAERVQDAHATVESQTRQELAQTSRTGIAILGGILALSGIMAGARTNIEMEAALGLGAGAALVILGSAIALLATSGIGAQQGTLSGPAIAELIATLRGDHADRARVLTSIVAAMPSYIDDNGDRLAKLERTRSMAAFLLVSGSFVVGGTIGYIVEGSIS